MTEHTPSSSEPSNEDQSARESSVAAAAPSPPAAGGGSLPVWAWALIAGAVVVAVGFTAIVIITLTSLLTSLSTYACSNAGICDEQDQTASIPDSTNSPRDDATIESRVTLDGNAVFDGQPVWSFTLEPSWHALTFDQDGINVFQDEATGCQLITSQSLALPDPDAVSDIEVSYSLLSREIAGFTGNDPGALILNRGATDIPIAVVGSDSTLEFASATIDQSNPEGVATSTEIAVRSMPASKSELVAALTCDTAAFETFGSKFELFSTALAVTATP